ncbi:MAG: hydroxymethylbilane synthase [Gammaproteobacteria bacterium]|nr:hydroxymethylbilane synthase [Gammaproteobacteria bacterium]
MTKTLRIATRRSPLAMWQAEHVASLLQTEHPGLQTALVPMRTRGDKILDRSLSKVGGKGLFIKELEVALMEDRADIAVHSMKDMPAGITPGLCITAVLERASPFDALVSASCASIDALPDRARVGTSSLRRASQMLRLRPDLEIVALRGNVETRLGKLDNGECVAIMLAVAGLERLGLDQRIAARLPAKQCLPAVGQGVIGIECRENDSRVRDLLDDLHNVESGVALAAERALGAGLDGNCQSPIAAFAQADGDAWVLRARVLAPDGSECIEGSTRFAPGDAGRAGADLAGELLGKGARRILDDIATAS